MKPKTPQSRVNSLILEEASEWFVDFRVGDVDAHSREHFDEWLRRSPEHIRAYMEIARIYVELPPVKLAGKIDVESLIAYAHSGENIVPFTDLGGAQLREAPAMAGGSDLGEPRSTRVARTPRIRSRFLAAACALVLMTFGVVGWQIERFPSYRTDIGERRSITLADGSTIDLNARSQVRIEFSRDQRRVELVSGQALFQVAKDKIRPFIVSSGEATVRAVGTQFDVNRRLNSTTVTVLEGKVAVYSSIQAQVPPPESARAQLTSNALSPTVAPRALKTPSSGSAPQLPSNPRGLADPSGSAAIFLSAGQQVTVSPAEVAEPRHADVAATTAWMERRLMFDGSRLNDVVQEFNRYNRRQLVIQGGQLSDFHVSGVYSSTDPASLIRFLRDQPGVKITESNDEIRIATQ
jgi:transmembrane sensor